MALKRWPGCHRNLIHVRSVVQKVAMTPVFLRVLRFFPVCSTPSMLHTYKFTRTNGHSLGYFQKALLFSEIGENEIRKVLPLVYSLES